MEYNPEMTNDTPLAACTETDRSRGWWAVGLNAVAPGSGLIVLRQDQRGVGIACVFAILGLSALWGLWIAPGILPRFLALASLFGAASVWILAQWVVWHRRRLILGETGRKHVAHCCALAAQAIDARRFAEAEAQLHEALRWNDEDPSVRAQWARLLVVMGRIEEARHAWETTLDLDKTGAFRREAIMAIERLPSEDGSQHAPAPGEAHTTCKTSRKTRP